MFACLALLIAVTWGVLIVAGLVGFVMQLEEQP